MIYIAKIADGIVSQVTVQPDDYEPAEGEALIGPDNTVGVGWSHQDGAFVAPAQQDDA